MRPINEAMHRFGVALANTGMGRAVERSIVWILDGMTAVVDAFTGRMQR